MVSYEISLILRSMSKPSLVSALKRLCTTVMNEGIIIKEMENLGNSTLPYAMSAHKERFKTGRYFTLSVESPPNSLLPVRQKLKLDNDVIRATILKQQ